MPHNHNHPGPISVLTILLSALLMVPSSFAIEVTTTVDENGANSAACALREAVGQRTQLARQPIEESEEIGVFEPARRWLPVTALRRPMPRLG